MRDRGLGVNQAGGGNPSSLRLSPTQKEKPGAKAGLIQRRNGRRVELNPNEVRGDELRSG